MRVFDRIRLKDVDRRDWQLRVLAVAMIVILAGGLALLMYSVVSPGSLMVSERTMLRCFFGFCLLTLLFVGYLIDRQVVIAHLRKELSEERARNLELRKRGSQELLQTLLGPGQFYDRLGLELERANQSGQPLSALTISLEALNHPVTPEVYLSFGEAAKSMLFKLRAEDSIYKFSPGVFRVLLPKTASADARRVAVRVAGGLFDVVGPSKRYSFDIRVTSFPEHAKSVREMESMMTMAHAA